MAKTSVEVKTMEINILFLSAGRRVELIRCFREAMKQSGAHGRIVAADIIKTAPAIYFADTYHMIPRISENNFIDSIISICLKEDISLIIPTIDTELLILSKSKQRIESKTNAKVLVSDESVIEICRNKYNTQAFFEKHGFGAPRQINEIDLEMGNFRYPLFIKPLDGSSSINTFKVNSEFELKFFQQYINKPLLQEFVEGDEYTIDAFLDFESNPITVVPRKRLAVRGGEISKGLIVKDREIIEEVRRLLELLRPIGHITIQCLKTDTGIKFIEINPRFGGGAPMSIKAGANSPLYLYKLISGEKLGYNEDYEDHVLALRFDDAVYLDSRGNILYDKGCSV